ncbi:sulfotransferase family 2 domain-containing protein [Celeribacter sp. SCSIO 80788]|uniref:sulfotransferase family 2 domain-containing protein n=1 Tax=Celeribacter sp. SCSIO 80788 TaxID=3117013 RepID=UPI003DA3CD3E
MGIVDQAKALRARLVENTMPQRFVFHHVPKCGGTSVGRALRKRYILSQATVKPDQSFFAFEAYSGRSDREAMLVDVAELREQMMLYHMFDDVHCVSLHVPFSDIAHARFAERYKFITVLREPVARFVSHYFWSYQKPNDHARIEEDFETFLGTERARRLGASYVEYYSGAPMAPDLAEPELIARAIANLRERFDVVGRLDDLPGFEASLHQALGVRIKVGHENKARQPQATRKTMVTPELMARAREVCAPDIAVWDAMFGAGGADD